MYCGDLQANTVTTISVGPTLDKDDADTEKTGVIADTDFFLSKNGGNMANPNDTADAVHDQDGMHYKQLNATDLNAEGLLAVTVHIADTLYIRQDYTVLSQAAYASKYTAKDTGYMDVGDVKENVDGLVAGTVAGVTPEAAGVAPTATEIVDEWESQANTDPTGFKVNVIEVNGQSQTANDNGADINTLITGVNVASEDDIDFGAAKKTSLNAATTDLTAITGDKASYKAGAAEVAGANVNVASEDNIDFGALKKTSLNAATPDLTAITGDKASYKAGTAEVAGAEVDVTKIHGSALTETASGRLAAAFIKLFDVATPALTAASVDQGADNDTILSSLTIADGAVDTKLTYIMDTILTEGAGGQLAEAFIKLFDVATPLLVASDVMVGTAGANTTTPPTVNEVRDGILDDATRFSGANIDAAISGANTTTPPTVNEVRDGILDDATRFSGGKIDATITSVLAKMLAYFRLALRSDNGPATDDSDELTAINANDGGGGGDYAATDAQEAIRDRGDAEWVTASGFATTTELNKVPKSSGSTGWNATALGQIEGEVDDAIATAKLDHLVQTAAAEDEVADNSIIARMVATEGDWSEYNDELHSLEAIRVRGDAAWITGGGGGITDILNVQPLIPNEIDLADTATVRLALGLTNMLDDLPSTVEITPGTITIDRKAIGGTSWTNVVNAAACSEAAGLIYYDEVFDSGAGYAEADSIRITFKGQKITVSANDYEITDATGWVFQTSIRQTMRGTDGANTTVPDASGTAPTATEIVDEWETQSQSAPTGFHVNVKEVNGTSQTANDNGSDIIAIKAKTDDQPAGVPKNVALSNFEFLMLDSSDNITPKTGETVTTQLSKDGGGFAGSSNSASEVGSGVYKINLTQAEMNADVITLKFTSSGANQRTVTIVTSA